MKLHLILLAAFVAISSIDVTYAQDKKATPTEAPKKGEAKRDTYPLYGKVVTITSRTLTIVRGDNPDAKVAEFAINESTQFVDGEKAVSIEAVKVGSWIGGSVKQSAGDGPDTVMKINVGVKQRVAKKAPSKSPKK